MRVSRSHPPPAAAPAPPPHTHTYTHTHSTATATTPLLPSLSLLPAVLRLSPADADALRVKAVLHVEGGAFEDALKLIAAAPPAVAASLAYERAYALYRQGQLEASLAALADVPADRMHAAAVLEAQLRYRLGDAAAAAEAYARLLSEAGAGAGVELQANAVAAHVACGRGAEVPAVMQALKVGTRAGAGEAAGAPCHRRRCAAAAAATCRRAIPPVPRSAPRTLSRWPSTPPAGW